MIHTTRHIRCSVILISIWTILQTVIHIFWVSYVYLLTMCQIKPSYYDVVFVYLTYFYKQSCGPIELRNETLFLNRSLPTEIRMRFAKTVVPKELYHFLSDVLHNGKFPTQSRGVARSELYLAVLFISDAAWIVSTLVLSIGACCRTKKKSLSIIFYGPWILCSAFIIFLDVVSSVQYGLDLIYIQNYTTWLRFVGVSNYEEFTEYDQLPSSIVLPLMPTTVVVSLLSRVFIVWLLNVICFFTILFLAVPDMTPKTAKFNSRRALTTRRPRSGTNLGEANSSEARIRNWQQFYGAIEANSTMTSPSSSHVPLNSTHRKSSVSFYREPDVLDADYSTGSRTFKCYEGSPDFRKDIETANDGGFRRFSDVASGISLTMASPVDERNADLKLPPPIKGYVPWSYINLEPGPKYGTKPVYSKDKTEKRTVESTRF